MTAAVIGVLMLAAGVAIGFRTARANQLINEQIAVDTRDALVDDAADIAADDEEAIA